jgi:hypothetical protein
MSGSKLPSSPAMWLWSLAIVLPPALAAIAATKPYDSAPAKESSSPQVVSTMPAATFIQPAERPSRTARRVLIDDAGHYPPTTLAADFWSLALEPAGNAPGGETTPAAETASETQPAPGDETTDVAAAPSSSASDLTPELLDLQNKVRQVLKMYYPRHQNARDNDPWEVMHAIIAYGVDTQLFKDRPGGEKANAVGWLCYNYPCEGQRLLFLNGGKPDVGRGVGLQGHGGQFLAMLAQSHVMSDYPLRIEGKQFTLADLIEHEKQTCLAGEELTFKLIALSHYLDSDETWKTPDGQDWSIPRLIREELKAPIRGAACGGTHRLMGFSYAVSKRAQRGEPIDGEFRRAQIYTQDYHRYTFSLQNDDGSFSTAWFERRAADPSIDRRLKTSGHILEWITFSLPDDGLRDPRTIKAVDYLATLLLTNNRHTWEIGPLGHGLHALALYNNRVFKEPVQLRRPPLAAEGDAAALEARHSPGQTD